MRPIATGTSVLRFMRLYLLCLVVVLPLYTGAIILPIAATTTISTTTNAQATPSAASLPNVTNPILATPPVTFGATAHGFADEAITSISPVPSNSTSFSLSVSVSAASMNITTLPGVTAAMLPRGDVASMLTAPSTAATAASPAATTSTNDGATSMSVNARDAGHPLPTITPTPPRGIAGLVPPQASVTEAVDLYARNAPLALGGGISNTHAPSRDPDATRRMSLQPASSTFLVLVKSSYVTLPCDHGASAVFAASPSTSAQTTRPSTASTSDTDSPPSTAATASSASPGGATGLSTPQSSNATATQAEARDSSLVVDGMGSRNAAKARTGIVRRLPALSGDGRDNSTADVPKNLTVLLASGHVPVVAPLNATTNATTVKMPHGVTEYKGNGLSSTTIFGIVFGLCLLIGGHTALCCLWCRCCKKNTCTRTPGGARASSASSSRPRSRVSHPAAGARRTVNAPDPSATALTPMVPTGSGPRRASEYSLATTLVDGEREPARPQQAHTRSSSSFLESK